MRIFSKIAGGSAGFLLCLGVAGCAIEEPMPPPPMAAAPPGVVAAAPAPYTGCCYSYYEYPPYPYYYGYGPAYYGPAYYGPAVGVEVGGGGYRHWR